jgi:Protein of unknown function (DUF4089)
MQETAMPGYVDIVADSIGLAIPEDCRADVIANIRMIMAQSADLMALALDDRDEIAAIFQP